ncbi:MAG TPA: EthD family reductase [Roseiflexaceae bacterium]|nr:EthD family reductase [Roseiflexaceae bacterium]
MIKLVCLYNQPADKQAFDTHYDEIHTPLVRQLPNLTRLEIARVTGAPRGESPYYLICEMYWQSREQMDADMASPEMRAVGKDARAFAGELLTMHIAEVVSS